MGIVEFRELCRYAQNHGGVIVFYDKYIELCRKKGVKPSRAAMDAGISKSLVTKWQTNKVEIPSSEVLSKLSKYFNIPVSELLGESAKKVQPTNVDGLYLENISKEDLDTIKAYLDMPIDQRRALAKLLGISE
jgi:transcriptional regulator with XRE-family HTH domain